MEEYLTLKQLANYTSLSKSTLRKFLGLGMPYFKLGRSIRIKRSDFDEWFAQYRSSNGTERDRRKLALQEAVEEVRK